MPEEQDQGTVPLDIVQQHIDHLIRRLDTEERLRLELEIKYYRLQLTMIRRAYLIAQGLPREPGKPVDWKSRIDSSIRSQFEHLPDDFNPFEHDI